MRMPGTGRGRLALLACVGLAALAGTIGISDAVAQTSVPRRGPPVPSGGWGEDVALYRGEASGGALRAYLADDVEGLKIYDLADPDAPALLGSFLPAAGSCPDGFLFDAVRVLGSEAYVAAGRCGVLVVDVSTPASPSLALRIADPIYAKDLALAVEASGSVLLLVADYFAGLRVIRVAEGASAPLALVSQGEDPSGQVVPFGEPRQGTAPLGAAVGVDAEPELDPTSQRRLVVTAAVNGVFSTLLGADGLPVADAPTGAFVTNPDAAPLDVIRTVPQDVALSDGLAYVPLWLGDPPSPPAQTEDGRELREALLVLDARNPSNPEPTGRIQTPHALFAAAVSASGSHLFVSEGQCGVAVFEILDEMDPPELREAPDSPLQLGGEGLPDSTPASCSDTVTDRSVPFAWGVAEDDGVVATSFGLLDAQVFGGAESAGFGGFQPFDFPASRIASPGSVSGAAAAADGDGDGVADGEDNCLDAVNPDQRDGNLDGYGDACDADVDDDGLVGVTDFLAVSAALGATRGDPRYEPRLDVNGDAVIGLPDFLAVSRAFGAAPGPSGLLCAGTTPCP
jgi:hypothetical protein